MNEILILLFLLVAINGAPIVACKIMGDRLEYPIDMNWLAWDGQPLLGPSKTIRGFVAAALCGACLTPLFGVSAWYGLAMGIAAMVGDIASSFLKRRARIKPSDSAPGLDQIPEVLLPLLIVRSEFMLDWLQLALIVAGFVIVVVLISPLLYRMKIRRRPH